MDVLISGSLLLGPSEWNLLEVETIYLLFCSCFTRTNGENFYTHSLALILKVNALTPKCHKLALHLCLPVC